jgi:hypothetical protein
MLVLKCSLLNREYVLIIALKALVSTVFVCSLHVIFLSNIMPRYFKLFKKGMFCPFSVRRDEVEVTLRPIVSRSVSLGVRPPSGISNQFFFLLDIFFRQLRVCYFVVPSLTRGQVRDSGSLILLT